MPAKDFYEFLDSFEYDVSTPHLMSKGFLAKIFAKNKKKYPPTIDEVIKITGLNINKVNLRSRLEHMKKTMVNQMKHSLELSLGSELSKTTNKFSASQFKKVPQRL